MNDISAPRSLAVGIGCHSARGPRPDNQDYAAALATPVQLRSHGVVAALADGVGGAKGGRVAAELGVRSFIEAYSEQPPVRRIADVCASSLAALNRWMHTQGRCDPALRQMASTFTALVLRGRELHAFHVGDSRLYRLRQHRLSVLTQDHVVDRPGQQHLLLRALGLESELRLDYLKDSAQPLDRYLLCSDGVHGPLREARLHDILARHGSPEETARLLVEAALDAGGQDNATALIVDVLEVPGQEAEEIESAVAALPIRPVPQAGQTIDGYRLDSPVADGRYSRLWMAVDAQGHRVVLKFPKERVGEDRSLKAAFAREIWVGTHVRNGGLGEVLELPAGQQQLYLAMPYYSGETLERRLLRSPALTLGRGIEIAVKLARAVFALHRAGVIHRDIKPDNVIVNGPEIRLIDFGSVRYLREPAAGSGETPGTASYMAPELFEGAAGDERSDLYALAVTLYRSFSGGKYPYGEIEPFSRPRFGRPVSLLRWRPDLPAWLDAELMRALSVNPDDRHHDSMEFAAALENAEQRASPARPQRFRPLYERNPLLFWKLLCAVLLLLHVLQLMKLSGSGG